MSGVFSYPGTLYFLPRPGIFSRLCYLVRSTRQVPVYPNARARATLHLSRLFSYLPAASLGMLIDGDKAEDTKRGLLALCPYPYSIVQRRGEEDPGSRIQKLLLYQAYTF